jgi:hypothetical protein
MPNPVDGTSNQDWWPNRLQVSAPTTFEDFARLAWN